MRKVLIIGGGAAGMPAAVFAAENGCEVHVFEKNEKLGKKLFITGKGRCNFTNAADLEDFFSAVVSNPKFLYSALYSFTNQQAMEMFEDLGVRTKGERGGRVLPASDHSSDIIRALERRMESLGVHIHLNTEVEEVVQKDGKFFALRLKNGEQISGDACIVATGGLSYPSTGSTGDGYRFAKACGHTVTELRPALVPMEVKEWYAKELQGLSLRNVNVWITDGKKKLFEEFGEMMFTHFGVTGPVILSASSYVGKRLRNKELTLHIDLKPALTEEMLNQRVLREFEKNQNRQFKNAVDSLFPAKLRPVMIERSGILEEKRIHEITKEERFRFLRLMKNFEMTLTGLRSYKEAIITQGGVNVREIDPGTMESKLVTGLYFIGETLDLDAQTGGFNIQIAISTAYLAALSAAGDEK